MITKKIENFRWVLCGVLILTAALSACDDSKEMDKAPGQALASVDGEEVTILQLNDEMGRARINADQREEASKQLLESLIDRQLLLAEAVRNKLDRTPKVMQTIERTKAQVIAQAYLQDVLGNVSIPPKEEVDEFYQSRPELFSQRKQFDLKVLHIASEEFSDELKTTIDAAKSLDDVVIWLDKHDVFHAHRVFSRSTSDMSPEMTARLLETSKGDIVVVNEQESSLVIFVDAIEESSVTLDVATSHIERHLISEKRREAAKAEVERLRSLANIEYFDTSAPKAGADEIATEGNDIVDVNPSDSILGDDSIERGISGLK